MLHVLEETKSLVILRYDENMYDACTCIALLTEYIAELKFRKKISCLTVYLMFYL
jgi:hypothetical protein